MFSILLLPGSMAILHFYPSRFQVTFTFKALTVVASFLIWSSVLYLGLGLWHWLQTYPPKPVPSAMNKVFIAWLILLVPWLLLAPLSGMAFDGGETPDAYAFVWSVWTYPVTVLMVAVFRRWMPWIVVLPVINFAGCFAGGLFPQGSVGLDLLLLLICSATLQR
jgi:hypothetical protein